MPSKSQAPVIVDDPRRDVHRNLEELSNALEIEAVPIGPQPLATHQPGPTATSSISEKDAHESDHTTSDAATNSASARPAAGQVRQRVRLLATDRSRQFLPGQPRIRLGQSCSAPGQEGNDAVLEYMRESHLTTELDGLLPYMKYIFVQTPAHKHIMPLHHQKAHGRDIILNEHPGLHLVWYYDRIFIKPIPAYMYSRAFWDYISDADPEVYKASLGFIRSYYYLIQFETDFKKACEMGLIPKKPAVPSASGSDAEPRHPSYEEFCGFMGSFALEIKDTDVNERFRYGELRLTRINKTTMFFKRKMAYFHMLPQWGSYLEHLLAPIVTVFAILTVILNALQVTLAAHEVGPGNVTDDWLPFINISLYLPVAVMILIGILLAFLLVGVLAMGIKDLIWAKTVRHRRKYGNLQAGEKSYGVIW